MQRSDLEFPLPAELIAQYPAAQRTASRLMVVDPRTDEIAHRGFADIATLLAPGDLLVVNDTRVIRARLYARKPTGGRVEILIERVLGERRALAHVRGSKRLSIGQTLALRRDADDTSECGGSLLIVGRGADLLELQFDDAVDAVLTRVGHVPLPPYIARADALLDAERYQTVYAAQDGAVAAPTAGLHFDEPLLAALAARGIARVALTLHVGAGTFAPLRSDSLAQHVMHAETYEVGEAVVDAIASTRAAGGRVVAVGTTVVRALESAASDGTLQAVRGETRLFVQPGFRFQVVDALITNFHLPGSTLIALVGAFAGMPLLQRAYREAIAARYRFYSYGDAMFVSSRDRGAA